jgi:hypothetical protein
MLSWFVVFRFGARAFVMVLFGAVVVLFSQPLKTTQQIDL